MRKYYFAFVVIHMCSFASALHMIPHKISQKNTQSFSTFVGATKTFVGLAGVCYVFEKKQLPALVRAPLAIGLFLVAMDGAEEYALGK